jgi:hypothetical protein
MTRSVVSKRALGVTSLVAMANFGFATAIAMNDFVEVKVKADLNDG